MGKGNLVGRRASSSSSSFASIESQLSKDDNFISPLSEFSPQYVDKDWPSWAKEKAANLKSTGKRGDSSPGSEASFAVDGEKVRNESFCSGLMSPRLIDACHTGIGNSQTNPLSSAKKKKNPFGSAKKRNSYIMP